ncbi:MAG: ATP-binding cassette domain-containing protein [Chloroflexota bacterium]|nr:ATP-binding cassette domain-containing protein [Chloroflexota bacterium]MDE2960310.1 ATP-binding cassette domain-containing protein [Chloroflexota bacterium]
MSTSPQDSNADDYARQFMPPERRARLTAEQPAADAAEESVVVAAAPPETAEKIPEAPPATDGVSAAVPEEAPVAESPPPRPVSDNGARPAAPAPAPEPWPDADDDDETVTAYVEANDLFKIYKPADLEVVALRGVDLEVRSGELIGIVGASGSGKTTLLNILAGLERPSAGRIRVGDRDLLDITDQDLVAYRRREVGFVWQATGRNLVPYLSVRDNIELPQAIAGAAKRQRRERAEELLEALQMGDKSRRYPSELSGGEQQRVAIAVALANNPPLLLADEPTGELDTNMAEDVFRMLQRINRRFGVTIIIVTHYAGIARWVDRVVRIRDGRIGSESYLMSSYRGDEGREEEYLVVDRAGRLQLPREYVEQLSLEGLATAGMDEDTGSITLRPASAPHRSRERWETVADD